MKISARESFLALITCGVLLIGATFLLGRAKVDEFREIRREQAQLMESIKRNKRMVGQRDKWVAKMEKLSDKMQVFPKNKRMDVYLSEEMEKLANKHGLTIIRHEVGEERQEGPIYELPIECRDWEGSIDSLVHFLFDLQNKGAMLDIRYLRIKPKSKTIRRGRFSLYCAYMREST
jgi:Tfp pilus assembly protein PilO